MKLYRIILIICLSAFFSNIFISCSNDAESEDDGKSPASSRSIIALYPPRSLGDNSYYDDISYTLHLCAIKNNAAIADIVSGDLSEAEENLKEVLESKTGGDTLILCADSLYLPFLEKYEQSAFEERQILVIGSREVENSAISTAFFPDYGVNMLAGVAARSLSPFGKETKCLCLLANDKNTQLLDGLKGFVQGFGASWNEKIYDLLDLLFDIEAVEEYIKTASLMAVVFDYNEEEGAYSGINHQVMGYGYTSLMQDSKENYGFNFYYPLYGTSTRGIGNYIKESKDSSFLFAGMNDNRSVSSEYIPFYVVKHIDKVVSLCVSQWISDKKIPHYQEFGLAAGYTELVINEDNGGWNIEQLKNAVAEAKETAIQKEREYEDEQTQ